MMTLLRKSGKPSPLDSPVRLRLNWPLDWLSRSPLRSTAQDWGGPARVRVTKPYGNQLGNARNLRFTADVVVNHLVRDYPTHAFVIDREEAGTLFRNVSEFSEEEMAIFNLLKSALIRPAENDAVIANFAALVADEASKKKRQQQEKSNAREKRPDRKTKTGGKGQSDEPKPQRRPNRRPPKKSDGTEQRKLRQNRFCVMWPPSLAVDPRPPQPQIYF